MQKFVRFQWVIIVLALGLWSASSLIIVHASETYGTTPKNIKEYLDKLVLAYPNAIERHDRKFLFMKNGKRFPISDNKTDKTIDELLAKPDIDDMFYVPYPEVQSRHSLTEICASQTINSDTINTAKLSEANCDKSKTVAAVAKR